MKPVASLDKASLTILQCARQDRIRQPNELEGKSKDQLVSEATEILAATHTLTRTIMREAENRVILAGCLTGCDTFDGKGRVHHARINSVGEDLLHRLESEEKEEKRHREIIRVTKASAWIAGLAALAAVASAWYAKVQADSAALSARANEASIVQPQSTPSQQPPSSTSEPALTAPATPKP